MALQLNPDDPNTVVTTMPSPSCGGCGHPHTRYRRDLTALPSCECGCEQYQLHPDEAAAGDRAEARDAAQFAGGRRILTGYGAHAIGQALAAIEGDWHQRIGWQAPTMFGVLYAGNPGQKGSAEVATRMILSEMLRLPDDFADRFGDADPAAALLTVAADGEASAKGFAEFRTDAGLDPAHPVLAWWAMGELIAVNPGGEQVATLRELICVDVDERVYSVVRNQANDKISRLVGVALPLYRNAAQPLLDLGVLRPGPQTGLPMMTEALLRCLRLTRMELDLRCTFAGLGDISEGNP